MATQILKPGIELDKGIYAIAGICKNSGKTSFLNWLLTQLTGRAIGVLTTGRDGEELDLVYGNPKPSVKLSAGTLFTSTSGTIDKLGSAVEVLHNLPFRAGSKKLWLLKALRDIETEIIGPANAAAQIQVAELMRTNSAEVILIDGSIDRKSIALHDGVGGVFLVAGGSYGNLDKISTELTKLVLLSQIAQSKDKTLQTIGNNIAFNCKGTWLDAGLSSLLGNEQYLMNKLAGLNPKSIYLPGAITDSVLNGIKPALKDIRDIAIRHPLQLHLNKANLDYLVSEHKLSSIKPFRLIAIAVNCWSVKGNHLDSQRLRNSVRQQFPMIKVIDICEG
jgi:hypothetical protein